MTDRSVPVTVAGKSYHLRFDVQDIVAVENKLGVGWRYFIKPGIFGSLTATEAFVWRGLRRELKDGKMEHVFEQDEVGCAKAGEMVFENITLETDDALQSAIFEAFVACGLYKKLAPGEQKTEVSKEDAEKNRA